MVINFIWPDLLYINTIAALKVSKLILKETIIESGRTRILADLRGVGNENTLKTIRVFVPYISESEYAEIDQEFKRLNKTNLPLKIEWYLTTDNPDNDRIKDRFKHHPITFFELAMRTNPTDSQYVSARYCLTRAFLGDPRTGRFNTHFFKKAIATFQHSNPDHTVKIPEYFRFSQPSIEGISKQMVRLKKRINNVANSGLNVMIMGDTGSGKEGTAFFIHDLSGKNKKKFEAINCALFDEQFLISELFGHVKGAYTGAGEKREGLIKKINGGTLFLDELPEMPKKCQAMLLRFLEDGRIRPLGSDRYDDVKYDVRIICAGQPDLLKEKVRKDLLFRIGEFPIVVPALKEIIREDMQVLIDHCLYNASAIPSERYTVKDFFLKHRSIFESYSWPGNVRQLFGFVKRRLKIGKEEEVEILNEITQERIFTDTVQMIKPSQDRVGPDQLDPFFMDLSVIISKHRNALPSSDRMKWSYTKLVSEELRDKTQKYIANDVLGICESSRKVHLKKLESYKP